VVLADIRLPRTQTVEGIRLAGGLRGTDPGVGVVILSPLCRAGVCHRDCEDVSQRVKAVLLDLGGQVG
jgi:hypothetical protein